MEFRKERVGSFRLIVALGVGLLGLSACGGGGLPGATPDERAIAAANLGINGADENIPVLLAAIEKDQELVQLQAISSLGRIGTDEAVAALAKVSDHESRACREAVALALRDVSIPSYPASCRVLVDMGKRHLPKENGDDPNYRVRQAIVTSLGVVQQPEGLEYLVDRLRNDADEHIRNAAVLTLGRLGDPRAVDLLIEVYHTDNEKNRTWAVESLGKIGDPRGLPVVLEALEDYDPVCRGKAAWALMQLKGDESRARLRKALDVEEDDMPAVVMAHALALLGEERAVELIEDRAGLAPSNFARAEACRVLGEIGRPESIPVLDKVFHEDRDGLVKREASKAVRALIARFPPPEAEQPG